MKRKIVSISTIILTILSIAGLVISSLLVDSIRELQKDGNLANAIAIIVVCIPFIAAYFSSLIISIINLVTLTITFFKIKDKKILITVLLSINILVFIALIIVFILI